MKLPEIDDAQKYVGLYVVDFGDSCSVGFTGIEVAELLESEKFPDVKVYKIHNAYPDGRMELKGVPRETFSLEMGMFFYSPNEHQAMEDYKRLTETASRLTAPARAKVEVAEYAGGGYAVVLIYPAEYDDEFSRWLIDTDYRTAGTVEGGTGALQSYYNNRIRILKSCQLFSRDSGEDMTGQSLIEATARAVVR